MKSLLARCVAVTVLLAGAVALPAAASAHEGCETPQDVPVVLDFGTLDGDDRVLCAQHSAGKTALDALKGAGVETADTTATMPMLCRVDGLPTREDEKCGDALDGAGYWAFMVAQEGKPWDYASVGVAEYELQEGDFIALKYQLMADGETVEVAEPADAQTRADAVVPDAEQGDATDEDEAADWAKVALPIAIVAVLLVAAAAFVVRRRRA